jgi:hypothetical protein
MRYDNRDTPTTPQEDTMPYTPPVAFAQIAVASNGNPQITAVTAFDQTPYMGFPPVAVNGGEFPLATDAEAYATALLHAHGILSDEAAEAGLVWVNAGRTSVNGKATPVRRAPLMGPEWKPLPGTRN